MIRDPEMVLTPGELDIVISCLEATKKRGNFRKNQELIQKILSQVDGRYRERLDSFMEITTYCGQSAGQGGGTCRAMKLS